MPARLGKLAKTTIRLVHGAFFTNSFVSRLIHASSEPPGLQAWQFVEAILTAPALGLLVETDRHPAVAQEVLHGVPQLHGNLLHDTHTAILMKEHGIRQIYTRDMDFHRFSFLEVIDPLSA